MIDKKQWACEMIAAIMSAMEISLFDLRDAFPPGSEIDLCKGCK